MRIIDFRQNIRRARDWRKRQLEGVDKLVVHQTYGNTLPQPNGINASARYCIEHRNWPTVPYHYYISKDGRIYQLNDIDDWTWHTKGANKTGIGVCLQGKFAHSRNPKLPDPTESQQESLHEFVNWAQDEIFAGKDFEDWLRGHYHFGKKGCPGFWAQGLVEAYRDGYGCFYEGYDRMGF